jgi:hypothetical protein
MCVAIFKFISFSEISASGESDCKLISIIAKNNAALKQIKSEHASINLVIRLLNVNSVSRIFNSLFYFLKPATAIACLIIKRRNLSRVSRF